MDGRNEGKSYGFMTMRVRRDCNKCADADGVSKVGDARHVHATIVLTAKLEDAGGDSCCAFLRTDLYVVAAVVHAFLCKSTSR